MRNPHRLWNRPPQPPFLPLQHLEPRTLLSTTLSPSYIPLASENFASSRTWNASTPNFGLGTILTGNLSRSLTADGTFGLDVNGEFRSNFATGLNDLPRTNNADPYIFAFISFDNWPSSPDVVVSISNTTTPGQATFDDQWQSSLVVDTTGNVGLSTAAGYSAPRQLQLHTTYRLILRNTFQSDFTYHVQAWIDTSMGPLGDPINAPSTYCSPHFIQFRNAGFRGLQYHLSDVYVGSLNESDPTPTDPSPGTLAFPTAPSNIYFTGPGIVTNTTWTGQSPDKPLGLEDVATSGTAFPLPDIRFQVNGIPTPDASKSSDWWNTQYAAGNVSSNGMTKWTAVSDIHAHDLSLGKIVGDLDLNGHTIDFTTTIDPATATPYDAVNFPNVWKIPSPGPSAVIYEDGRPLRYPLATSFTSPANESGADTGMNANAFLNTTPGSQYNDGTWIYFSTRDNLAPISHTYFRGASGVEMGVGTTGWIHGGSVRGITQMQTTGVLPTSTLVWCFPAGGLSIVDLASTDLWGKHAITVQTFDASDNHSRAVITCPDLGAGPPADGGDPDQHFWVGINAAGNPLVVQNGAALDVQVTYHNTNLLAPCQNTSLSGPTAFFNSRVLAFLSHVSSNGNGANAVASISFTDCDFSSGGLNVGFVTQTNWTRLKVGSWITASFVNIVNASECQLGTASDTPFPSAIYLQYNTIATFDYCQINGLPTGSRIAPTFNRMHPITTDGITVAYDRTPFGSILARYLVYKKSAFDLALGTAVAPDKVPLFPGQTASFENYSSYSRGINGILIDVLGPVTQLTADDFTFKVGNDNNPDNWSAAPAPTSITLTSFSGLLMQVLITWQDNAIANQWLQVTLKANINSGLPAPDVFYFGNAIGESGNSATDAKVDAIDQLSPRYNATDNSEVTDPIDLNYAGITNPFDYNRDNFVDNLDESIARQHFTYFLNQLQLIQPPAPPAPLTPTIASQSPSLTSPSTLSPSLTPGPGLSSPTTAITSETSLTPQATTPSLPLTKLSIPNFAISTAEFKNLLLVSKLRLMTRSGSLARTQLKNDQNLNLLTAQNTSPTAPDLTH